VQLLLRGLACYALDCMAHPGKSQKPKTFVLLVKKAVNGYFGRYGIQRVVSLLYRGAGCLKPLKTKLNIYNSIKYFKNQNKLSELIS